MKLLLAIAFGTALTWAVQADAQAKGKRAPKVIQLEEIKIEGRVQKPNAFYVLQRSSIDYDWETLKQDFLPRILDATQKNPF